MEFAERSKKYYTWKQKKIFQNLVKKFIHTRIRFLSKTKLKAFGLSSYNYGEISFSRADVILI